MSWTPAAGPSSGVRAQLLNSPSCTLWLLAQLWGQLAQEKHVSKVQLLAVLRTQWCSPHGPHLRDVSGPSGKLHCACCLPSPRPAATIKMGFAGAGLRERQDKQTQRWNQGLLEPIRHSSADGSRLPVSTEGCFLLSVWHSSCPAQFSVPYFPFIDTWKLSHQKLHFKPLRPPPPRPTHPIPQASPQNKYRLQPLKVCTFTIKCSSDFSFPPQFLHST